MRFKTDWVSLITGSKFTVFLCFALYLRAIFQVQAPPGGGAYIGRGDLTEGFLRCRFGGLIFGGAYTWRGLFSEFYGMLWFCCGSSQFCRLSALGCKIIAKNLNSNALINALRD